MQQKLTSNEKLDVVKALQEKVAKLEKAQIEAASTDSMALVPSCCAPASFVCNVFLIFNLV